MYYTLNKVARITPEQVEAVKRVIPSLTVTPVTSLVQAFKIAHEEATDNLERYEYLNSRRELVEIPAGTRWSDWSASSYPNLYSETPEGWEFQFIVFGD